MIKIVPQPLYDKRINLALCFTPKAACSFGVKWFFYQTGHYDDCLKFHYWPHEYRLKVYDVKFNSNLDNNIYNSNVIFLVRDPLKRAVSSYFHGLLHNLEVGKMSTFFKRNVENEKFSFNEFIQFLKTRNLETCNPHFKIQSNVLSDDKKIKNKFIIKSENILENFRNLEENLNLKKSPLNEISDSLSFHVKKKNESLTEFFGDKILTKTDIQNGNIPDYKYFYNQSLIDDVYNLYKSDFINYDYKPEI